jgi:AraC-like DNA-binding protein
MKLILDDNFDDLDALAEAVQHWDIDFRLLEAGGFAGRVKQIVSEDVLLGYARFGRRLDQAGGIPPGFRTFVLPAAGCRGFWWRGFAVNSNDLLVFPQGSELRSATDSDFEVYLVSISDPLLQELAEDLRIPFDQIFGRRSGEVIPLASSAMEALRRDAAGILTADTQLMSAHAVRNLAGRLVGLTATSCQLSMSPARKRDRALDRVVDYVRSEPNPDQDLAALCRIAGASERTLQYAFQERYGISPARFVKCWKLNTARRRFLVSGTDAGVGDVAYALGFSHQSQFAADYQHLFGELPSQTIRLRRPRLAVGRPRSSNFDA